MKSEICSDLKSQNISVEPTNNLQEEQPKHNSVQIKCPVKINRDERNLHTMGYGHNEIVKSRAELNPLYSTLVPFTPKSISLGGLSMIWVHNIFSMVGYLSHFEASVHEVKCKASIQNKTHQNQKKHLQEYNQL